MSSRYAIYLAPEPASPLWRLGSALLGYDAATGLELPQPEIFGIAPEAWHRLTEDPRRYGFHLTVKAPFRLGEGVAITALEQGLATFATQCESFVAGELALEIRHYADGTGFVCLAPARPSPSLMALEAAIVPHFEPFRAPLSPQEQARRKPESLPERERSYLDRFGYPFVLDAFRPHFSLTGRHAEPGKTAVALTDAIGHEIGDVQFVVNRLYLFEQSTPSARFVIRSCSPFGRGKLELEW